MTGRVVFACLVGLVGAGLMGCARTSPEISSFELGRQLQQREVLEDHVVGFRNAAAD